jgi:hypothetical protein
MTAGSDARTVQQATKAAQKSKRRQERGDRHEMADHKRHRIVQ